jgi:hypothetical protein
MGDAQPAAKRVRQDGEALVVRHLTEAIVQWKGGQEIEVRLGRVGATAFEAKVSPALFGAILEVLWADAAPGKRQAEVTELVLVENTVGVKRRFFCDTARRVLRVNRKETMAKWDVAAIPLMPFDVRVAHSVDVDLSSDAPAAVPAGCTERLRTRLAFTRGEELCRIDMSRVRVGDTEALEVEVEVLEKALGDVHAGDVRDVPARAALLAQQVWGVVRFLGIAANTVADPHWFGDVPVGNVAAGEAQALAAIVSAAFGTPQGRFPGAMPVNFHRTHFAVIQREKYYVAEKTDGVRYMMVVPHNPALPAALFDRKMLFQGLDREVSDVLRSIMATGGGMASGDTIIDAELVRH